MKKSLFLFTLLLSCVSFSLAGCGGAGTDLQGEFSLGSPDPSGAVSFDDLESATVQIVTQGSLVVPGGLSSSNGSGSGFIVDPSGLIVTNNHVTTGASIIQVLLPGDTKPKHAKLVGYSECSDLAVLDIEEDDLPYMAWYEANIKVGLEVYAAGFPLGDPEFTLTKGVVAKKESSQASSYTGAQMVLQHDADLQPGNSGGPLVDKEGKVVGINYFGITPTALGTQFFAISKDEARGVIEKLIQGENINSLGINGQVFFDENQQPIGIWVYGVASGSPASKTGIKGGDIILTLEGLPMGQDGTLSSYCDILRGHNPNDPLNIQVYRSSLGTTLEGEINGTPFQTSPGAPVLPNPGNNGNNNNGNNTGGAGGNFKTVTDPNQVLRIDVPENWADFDSGTWYSENNQDVGYFLKISTNITAFDQNWETPGVFFGASHIFAQNYDPDAMLDGFNFFDDYCQQYGGRTPFQKGAYAGKYETWNNCGGLTTSIVNLVVESEDVMLLIQLQLPTQVDFQDAQQIMGSFEVIGNI